jgi:hypothetical protein
LGCDTFNFSREPHDDHQDDYRTVSELAEKGADADLLRDMLQFVAQGLMDMDVESLCAAFYGERSPERLNSRNG